jgi:hypothetical protein
VQNTPPILAGKDFAAPSRFLPENLLREPCIKIAYLVAYIAAISSTKNEPSVTENPANFRL